jgi:hypothetical protein
MREAAASVKATWRLTSYAGSPRRAVAKDGLVCRLAGLVALLVGAILVFLHLVDH